MTNPELEEKLREAACFGDIDGVKELITKGVNVNSQHDINGWTALHWAAKRNHLNIVNKLLNHGADKSIKTNKGEMPGSLTTEGVIKVLLTANLNNSTNATPTAKAPSPAPVKSEDKLAITPNYIRSPVLGYKVDTRDKDLPVAQQEKRPRIENSAPPPAHRRQVLTTLGHEMILKVRVAEHEDPDFIEIEIPGDSLTMDTLALVAASELGVDASQVERLRRLPNTRLRRDKEVARLPDYTEIELVMNHEAMNH